MEMNKQLAEKIIRLNIQEQQLQNERYQLRKELDMTGWDEICTNAMKFLMEESNAISR